jgi:hypothetical protein
MMPGSRKPSRHGAGWPVQPYPTHCLAHLVEETVTAEMTMRTYELHEIRVIRPASDHTVVTVRCGTCDELIDGVVDSVVNTEARRRGLARRRRHIAVLRWSSLTVALAGFTCVVVLDTLGGRFAWVVAAAVLGCVVAFMGLTFALMRMDSDLSASEGVALVSPSGTHRIRPPGEENEVIPTPSGSDGDGLVGVWVVGAAAR